MFFYKKLRHNILFFSLIYFSLVIIFPLKASPETNTFKDNQGNTPQDLLKNLFTYYKTQDFNKAMQITSGKMQIAIKSALEKKQKSGNSNIISYYTQLKDFKVIGQQEYNNFSMVSLFWVYYLPEKYNKNIHYTKITYVDYLLKKDQQGIWKITDAKFKNEYILYNKAPVYEKD